MYFNLLITSSKLVKLGLIGALLTMLCVSGAHANFVGSFAPSQWSSQPDQGQTQFISNSELDIIGPTGNFYPSTDVVSLLVPATTGGAWGWQLSFNWAFSAGGSESVEADISTGGNPVIFASGGAGTSLAGSYSLLVTPGETLSISLTSDETGSGKQPSSFKISGFSFAYSAPDVTPWIDFALVLPLFGRRFLLAVGRK